MAGEGESKDWKEATLLVRGASVRSANKETSEALYLTSGFVYDTAEEADARFAGTAPGYLYGRYANPTNRMLEERLAALEGAGVGRLAASGMAAVTAALLAPLRAGDHVVAGKQLFGSCRWVLETLMPRYGIAVTLVDAPDLAAWQAAVRPTTKTFFVETPANPTLEVVDLAALSGLAKAAGARLIVDNIFATPILQKPMALGADIVVYSTTKHMDGQGRTLGGAILCDEAFAKEHLDDFLRHTGPALSPFNAWVVLKGLETLGLRVRAMSATAQRLAAALEAHPAIARVMYPGLASHPQHAIAKAQMESGGTLIAFDVGGGQAGAFAFLNALSVIDISNNLGDAKSLATHCATTTHRSIGAEAQAAVGITPGTVRLSVGLEDGEDLERDLMRALEAAR
jgi:O-succinylhomoserine sulfhydrylase